MAAVSNDPPFTEPPVSERLRDARMLFRRGYAWIDACGNAGISHVDFPYEIYVTERDESAHDAVWSY